MISWRRVYSNQVCHLWVSLRYNRDTLQRTDKPRLSDQPSTAHRVDTTQNCSWYISAMENSTKMYRIYKTITRMLNDRGYLLSQKELERTADQVRGGKCSSCIWTNMCMNCTAVTVSLGMDSCVSCTDLFYDDVIYDLDVLLSLDFSWILQLYMDAHSCEPFFICCVLRVHKRSCRFPNAKIDRVFWLIMFRGMVARRNESSVLSSLSYLLSVTYIHQIVVRLTIIRWQSYADQAYNVHEHQMFPIQITIMLPLSSTFIVTKIYLLSVEYCLQFTHRISPIF